MKELKDLNIAVFKPFSGSVTDNNERVIKLKDAISHIVGDDINIKVVSNKSELTSNIDYVIIPLQHNKWNQSIESISTEKVNFVLYCINTYKPFYILYYNTSEYAIYLGNIALGNNNMLEVTGIRGTKNSIVSSIKLLTSPKLENITVFSKVKRDKSNSNKYFY